MEREYRAVSAQRRTFDLIVPGMYMCRVSGRVSDLLRVSFGYALGPVDWQALRRRTKPDGFVERTPLAAIGDEAFYTTGLGGIEAYARTGEYVVAVTVTGPTTVSDLGLLLNRLVLAAEPGWHDHPIVLPDGCPAAEDAAVTGLLGTVTYARGGFYRVPGVTTRQAFCHYVNERGELAAVDAEEHRKDYPDVVDLVLDTTGRIVEPRRGGSAPCRGDRTGPGPARPVFPSRASG